MLRLSVLMVLGFTLLVNSCGGGRKDPKTISDTTGVTYGWSCSSDGCAIKLITGTPQPNCEPNSFYGYFAGRLVVVCPAYDLEDGDWGTNPTVCRALTCKHDGDCPLWQDQSYSCYNGLCQYTKLDLFWTEVVALCLADTQRAASCKDAIEGAAELTAQNLANDACGKTKGPCTVPASCRQP
jgi:hypothetical protein